MADKNYPVIIVTHTIATLSNEIGYLAPKTSLLILFQFLAYFVHYAIIKADFYHCYWPEPLLVNYFGLADFGVPVKSVQANFIVNTVVIQ